MDKLPPFLGKFSFQSTSTGTQNFLTAMRLNNGTYLPGMAAATVTDLETCLLYGDNAGSVVQLGNLLFLALNAEAGQVVLTNQLAAAALFQLAGPLAQQTWQLAAASGWQTVAYSTNSVTPYLTINDVVNVPGYYSVFNTSQLTPGAAAIQAAQQAQQADLSHADLTGVDFTGVNFTGANFSGANLTGTNFSRATLTGAVFTGATLAGTQFGGATLDAASFTTAATNVSAVSWGVPASAKGILFTGCQGAGTCLGNATTRVDCSGANLSNANFNGATLDNLNLQGANLSGCFLAQGASCQATVFDGATLAGVLAADSSFQNASFNQAACHGAVFTRANLSGTHFQSAQLGAKQQLFTLPAAAATELNGATSVPTDVGQVFSAHNCQLLASATVATIVAGQNWRITSGNDSYSILYNDLLQVPVVYQYGGVVAADLTDAQMSNAVFTSANLFGANLTGVSWTGSQASGSNADFESASLSGAFLLEASFSQAQFLGTQAQQGLFLQAKFTGAHFGPDLNNVRANFTGAQFQGADFTNATLSQVICTNAAVALPAGVPLLVLPLSYLPDLQQANLTPVQSYFATEGYPVSSQATLASQQTWTITDAAATYLIDNALNVRNASTNAFLFQLAASMKSFLSQTQATSPLVATFEHNNCTLAVGDAISSASTWVITNVNDTCAAAPVIYQLYTLYPQSDGLHVFGTTTLWLANPARYTATIAFGATSAYATALDAASLCPNGYPASYPGFSWEQMLTTN